MTRLPLVIVVALAACDGPGVGANGGVVGAACTSDNQCAKRCLTGDSHYPGGMCTLTCASDRDCPDGASCVDDEGGICAVSCRSNADCTAFGRGFVCDDKDRRGASGDALVCRVP